MVRTESPSVQCIFLIPRRKCNAGNPNIQEDMNLFFVCAGGGRQCSRAAQASRSVSSDMSPYTFTKQRNEVDLTRRASLRSCVGKPELSWNGKHVTLATS